MPPNGRRRSLVLAALRVGPAARLPWSRALEPGTLLAVGSGSRTRRRRGWGRCAATGRGSGVTQVNSGVRDDRGTVRRAHWAAAQGPLSPVEQPA